MKKQVDKNIILHKMLEKILEEENISQSELARKMEVSRVDISLTFKNLKEGKSITTIKLFKMLEALGYEIKIIKLWRV